MMFGNYLQGSYSKIRLPDGTISQDESKGYAKHLVTLSFIENGIEKMILVTKAAPTLEDYTCHVCAFTISVGVFSKDSDHWKIAQVQKNIGTFGSFGEVLAPKLVEISPTNLPLSLIGSIWGKGMKRAVRNTSH